MICYPLAERDRQIVNENGTSPTAQAILELV